MLILMLLAGDVGFAQPPALAKQGDRWVVTFALTQSSDVEVAVLNAAGDVVRHLAAGVLGGPNPPPPPLRTGLAQAVEWDGRDDFGKPGAGGPFSVRVRAGLGVKLGRFVGEDPYTFGAISSIATDEGGRLYVGAFVGGLNQNMDTLRVFGPDGAYERTLIPFPETLEPSRAAAFSGWDASRRVFRPKNGQSQLPRFYPWSGDVRVAGVSAKAGLVLTQGTNVFRLDLDGGNLRGPAPMWAPEAKLKNPAWNVPQIAVSPDGRWIYFANVAGTVYDPKHAKEIDVRWPQGRVYRQDASKPGDPEKFYDLELPDWETSKHWLPNAWNCRTAAYHLAVDPAGRVLIGDLVNQQVVEVDPAGKKLSETKVAWPERVHVDPTSGALYVLSRLTPLPQESSELKLVKIVGRGAAARQTAELPLKISVNRHGVGTALGRIGGAAALWIGSAKGLTCVKDLGESLAFVETRYKPRPKAQADWNRLVVDAGREEIYTSDGGNLIYRYSGKTGEGAVLEKDGKPFHGVDVAVGYDGLLYWRSGTSFSGPLERTDRDLKPVPFATGTHVLSPTIYSRYGVGNCEKGLGVGPKGECYVNFMYGWNKYFVAGFGPEGKAVDGRYLRGKIGNQAAENKEKKGYPDELKSAVVGPITAACGGIRVDLQGNVYVGLRVRPKGFRPPPGLEKDAAFSTWTGSIVRFGPEGGAVINAVKEDNPADAAGALELEGGMAIVGARHLYAGVAPFSGDGFGGGSSCCVCRVPRFDLDRYGRLIYTNAVTNSVALVDNAGNPILDFGSYGNFDAGRSGTSVVPLAWPTGAGFGRDHVYVNDVYNRRVVRVDPVYALEAKAALK
ncbi:MAG TPA: hypothetical protein VF950_07005 [Planctomycetota bacterium]